MECYPGIEQSHMFQLLCRCMETRVTVRMEKHFIYPDGSSGWFDLSMQPAPEGVIILSQDVTQRKTAEDKLWQSELQIRNFAGYLNKTIKQERACLSCELYDGLAQHLAGIKMVVHDNVKSSVDDAIACCGEA